MNYEVTGILPNMLFPTLTMPNFKSDFFCGWALSVSVGRTNSYL
jgi:hypothetical protein